MGVIRTFIGIGLDDDIREELGDAIDELKATNANVRWVKPGNIHITLKFLGNIEEDRVGEIENALKPLGNRDSFELTAQGAGVLPNPRYPRVVYAGLETGVEALKELNRAMEDTMETMGFKREERDFLPHLTLGRVKSFRAKSLLMMKIRELQKKEFGSIAVNGFSLIQSDLRPTGSVYTELANIPLSKGVVK
ncbi:MAG: RNA 2',3'-cyclic phosphodiesterase [Nitrospinota bacterium]